MRGPKRWLVVAAACVGAFVSFGASAQDKLRVGKAVAEAFAFLPLDVGVRQGIFKRHGLDVEIIAFGAARGCSRRWRRQHRHGRERGP